MSPAWPTLCPLTSQNPLVLLGPLGHLVPRAHLVGKTRTRHHASIPSWRTVETLTERYRRFFLLSNGNNIAVRHNIFNIWRWHFKGASTYNWIVHSCASGKSFAFSHIGQKPLCHNAVVTLVSFRLPGRGKHATAPTLHWKVMWAGWWTLVNTGHALTPSG